jgi:methylglutaconyl-CoA hydratase
MSAMQAEKIGLLHETVDPENLDERIQSVIDNLLAGATGAQKAAKDLIDAVANRSMTRELMEETAVSIASIRATDEAREGLSAFLEKRPASWVPQR